MTGQNRGYMQAPSQTPAVQATVDLPRLLSAAAAGDQAAWRELVELYGRRVFALARSRVGSLDLAEEITQSVFVTISAKLKAEGGTYNERGKFESWLFRIAMNRVRDEIRRRKRHAEPTDPEHFEAVASSNGPAAATAIASDEHSGEMKRLRLAMAGLSDADREIVELRHHGGLSFAQMAEMLGEPLGTLLARHHRALKKLKDLLMGSGEMPGATGRAGLVEDES